jgi:uncharacterized protein YndB with AHSA1/START domain
MSEIEKQIQIAAPIERVWAALTDPVAIYGWMGDDSTVEVDLRVGGRYWLFGGETTGAFTRIEKPNVLEYTWRQGEWRTNWPDSLVHWELAASGKGTRVHLTHSRFPNEKERDSHDEGWDVYFLGPMRKWLESNALPG